MDTKQKSTAPKTCFKKWIDLLQDAVLYYVKELTHLENRGAPLLVVECIQDVVLHYLTLLVRANLMVGYKSCNQQDAMLQFLNELRYAEKNLSSDSTIRNLQNILLHHINALNRTESKCAWDPTIDQMQSNISDCLTKLNESIEKLTLKDKILDLKFTTLNCLTRLSLGDNDYFSETAINEDSTTDDDMSTSKNKSKKRKPCRRCSILEDNGIAPKKMRPNASAKNKEFLLRNNLKSGTKTSKLVKVHRRKPFGDYRRKYAKQ